MYYSFERETLLRFSPGMNAVCLGVGVDEHDLWQGRGWAASDCGGSGAMDPRLYKPSMRRAARTAAEVMRNTSQRPPHYNCFGLHEWAMLYAPPTHADSEPLRHQSLPLRVEQHTLNSVVESNQLACTHFDAFRFYTDEAKPLNSKELTREHQLELEQPGCVHATMDLFKLAMKLAPFIESSLVADCFDLARQVSKRSGEQANWVIAAAAAFSCDPGPLMPRRASLTPLPDHTARPAWLISGPRPTIACLTTRLTQRMRHTASI